MSQIFETFRVWEEIFISVIFMQDEWIYQHSQVCELKC